MCLWIREILQIIRSGVNRKALEGVQNYLLSREQMICCNNRMVIWLFVQGAAEKPEGF